MSRQEILQLGNPTLLEKCARVDEIISAATESVIKDLSDTLAGFREATGFGRGIAAPQIGVLRRVIFIRMQPTGFTGALINPEVV
ncbi:MAG TPA: peptide deformylase, partial [Blastocatellia bacterium]